MKKSSISRFLIASISVLILVSLIGCSTRILDFTVISSKNVNIKVKDSARGERVSGEDMAVYVFFPLGQPQVKNAVDRAIEKAGPGFDALLDGVIYYKYNVFILFGSFGYTVEGTPIKTSQLIVELQKQGIDPEQYFAEHNIVRSTTVYIPQ
jgi:hypothetical protein